MASPSAKYSNSASTIIKASARASHAVEAHSTSPTTTGIRTTAVATRFQVMKRKSPQHTARKVNSHRSKVERKRGGKVRYYSAEPAQVTASLRHPKVAHEELEMMREAQGQIENSDLLRTYAINDAMNQLILSRLD